MIYTCFSLNGNSIEKMNSSYVTALWAPHTVGGRPQRATATRGGAGSTAAEGLAHAWALEMRAISRSLAQYRTIDLEGKVKKMSEFTGIEGDLPTLHIFVRKVLKIEV